MENTFLFEEVQINLEMKIYVSKQVGEIRELQQGIIGQTDEDTTVIEQLTALAQDLHSHFHQENNAVTTIINNWHPEFIGKDADSILAADFSMSDAKLSIAKEHGFSNWNDVKNTGDTKFNFEFESAVDALLMGDIDSLAAKVIDRPSLLKERSRFGHRATLLHYVSSNGVETRRQIVPLNLPEITRLLLEKGADKNAKMRVYGGEFTALELASTSAHPKEAGVVDDLIKILKEA